MKEGKRRLCSRESVNFSSVDSLVILRGILFVTLEALPAYDTLWQHATAVSDTLERTGSDVDACVLFGSDAREISRTRRH